MLERTEVEISGITFVVRRMGGRAQLEVECILARVLGPAFAAGISVVAGEAARQLAVFARAVTKTDGDGFDLQRLIPVIRAAVADKTATLEQRIIAAFLAGDTSDEKLRLAWISLTDAAPEIARTILIEAAPALAERLTFAEASRVFELAVFGRVSMGDGATVAKIGSWADLDALTKRHPGIKWALLVQSLVFTYTQHEHDEGE